MRSKGFLLRYSVVAATVLAIFCVAGTLAVVVAPPMIMAAYEGRSSISFLNDLFARQPERPLALYVDYAQTSLTWISLFLVSGICGFTVALDPRCQAWWDRNKGRAQPVNLRPCMGGCRIVFVLSLLVGIPALTLVASMLNAELWPFSPYRMYSNSRPKQGPAVTQFRLYGVVEDAGEVEVPFPREPQGQPFQAAVVLGTWSRRDDCQQKIESALRALLMQYEQRQLESAAIEPQLVSVRLYREEWDALHPMALDRGQPHRRELVAQVYADKPLEIAAENSEASMGQYR